ncbi:MAG: dethiobiotin synthase [Solirubrobacteraceae bacterium]
MPRGCFVTATDTGVGKTILAAVITSGLASAGVAVKARKPIATGISRQGRAAGDRLGELDDHELLAVVSGERAEQVSYAQFEPAVSPHLAAQLSGTPIDVPAIIEELRSAAASGEALIVEGVGGLLVPLAPGWDVRGLAAALGFPVLIAARPGLGTINHTLLTLETARRSALDVRAVVLTPWPDEPDEVERSNRATIARLGRVEVATLPWLPFVTRASLAEAADGLDYERWLA